MQRTCVKCGHVNPQASSDPLAACPACGAIYAKATPSTPRAPGAARTQSGFGGPSGFGQSGLSRPADDGGHNDLADFVARMREQSLYPTVRSLVRWTFILMAFIAAVMAIAGLWQFFRGSTVPGAIGVGFALFLLTVSFVLRELSLMVIDLSDASVRSAAAAEARR